LTQKTIRLIQLSAVSIAHLFMLVYYKLIIKSFITLKNWTRTTERITSPSGNMH